MKSSKKQKRKDRLIFDTIRKPTAPPTRKFGSEGPVEKKRPSLRKSKHKRPPETEE